MTYNYEVFQRDPRTNQIPNDGVAKIGEPQDTKAWSVLRFELENFVCDGNYHAGLVRVLRSFLDQLERGTQPAVWVSGFFGSGKSHFVRVLEYLWRDLEFPDGATSRSLVTTPEDVRELLVELTNRARQAGGLWSAAGTLQAGSQGSIRLAILGILLNSARLPTNYAQARFMIWLREKDYEDRVKAALGQQLNLNAELSEMYVSKPLADAILQAIPEFAASSQEVRNILRIQFPQHEDVSNEEMLALMARIMRLSGKDQHGELPYTLIILDELQQYLGGDAGSSPIQQIIEACCSYFGGRLLFVATGQSAITANSAMQKLQARFTVRVELSDQDVDQVVRQVALRKHPEHIRALEQLLDQQSGEINRQLRGTRIGPIPADRTDLVASYPLLPTRRRFWEATLRAVDPSGATGMLRTQLRIVMEAINATADYPLGHVIPADFIFEQQRSGMRNSGVLSADYDIIIANLKGTAATPPLSARLCALIFLIDRLDRDGPLATDLHPTIEVLTDLLVEDLSLNNADLKRSVGETLALLCEAGTLLAIDDSYHLQTRESAVWSQTYQYQFGQISNDTPRLESERRDAIKLQVGRVLRGSTSIKIGKSKTERRGELVFSTTIPLLTTDAIPLWIRDGWEINEATALQEARDLGEESPIITIFLPKRDADALRETLAQQLAVTVVLTDQPPPQSDSAREAKQAMESRRDTATAQLEQRLHFVLEQAIVIQGGGNVIDGTSLAEAVKEAIRAASTRLYPRFVEADHSGWGTAFEHARDGAADALTSVDFDGEPQSHPTCRAILDYISSEARKGDAIRKWFIAPPYGWPQDAIDAALVTLVHSCLLHATRDGLVQIAKQLTHAQISQTIFQREGVTISTTERLAIRKMLQEIGVTAQSGNENEALTNALQHLRNFAHQAGGEPPCPTVPDTTLIDEILNAHGNEALKLAFTHRIELQQIHDEWKQRRETIQARKPRWDMLTKLLIHAKGLPIFNEVAPQIEAIREQRQLLAEPDLVPPLSHAVAGALRQALGRVVLHQQEVFAAEEARLHDLPEWGRLNEGERVTILRDQQLSVAPTMPEVGTESQLLITLDILPLAQRKTEIDAMPQRFASAKAAAGKLLEPTTTRLRPFTATVRTRVEVEAYIIALRDRLLRQIESGPVFIEGE